MGPTRGQRSAVTDACERCYCKSRFLLRSGVVSFLLSLSRSRSQKRNVKLTFVAASAAKDIPPRAAARLGSAGVVVLEAELALVLLPVGLPRLPPRCLSTCDGKSAAMGAFKRCLSVSIRANLSITLSSRALLEPHTHLVRDLPDALECLHLARSAALPSVI